jgi:hypothetical protein
MGGWLAGIWDGIGGYEGKRKEEREEVGFVLRKIQQVSQKVGPK